MAAREARKMQFNMADWTSLYRYRVQGGEPIDRQILDYEMWKQEHVVYARVWLDGPGPLFPVYIGVAGNTIKGRIEEHLRPSTRRKRTSVKYWQWAERKCMTIVAHKPSPTTYMGLPMHYMLETALIEAYRPRAGETRPWFTSKINGRRPHVDTVNQPGDAANGVS